MFVYLITNKINGKMYVGQHAGCDLLSIGRRPSILLYTGTKERGCYIAQFVSTDQKLLKSNLLLL